MKEHRLVRTKYDRSKSITSVPRVETGKTRTPKIKSEACPFNSRSTSGIRCNGTSTYINLFCLQSLLIIGSWIPHLDQNNI